MRASKFITAMVLTLVLAFTGCLLGACGGETVLALSQTSVTMEQYEEVTLTVNKEGAVEWSSSDPRTVRVEDGKLTSLKLGDAVITAKLGEEQATCQVSVKASTKGRALTVSAEEVTVPINETVTVTAELKENGATVPATLTWVSDHPEIAAVNNGAVAGLASGKATITVSTVYKGQAFSKEIAVAVVDDSSASAVFELIAAEPDGTLSAYTGDVTSLGFAEGTEVLAWSSVTQEGSAVWAEGVDKSAGDRLVVDIVLASGSQAIPVVSNGGVTVTGCGTVAGTRISSVLYYNASGELVSSLSVDTLYTLVVDLRAGQDGAYSLSLTAEATAYLANAVVCSNEYYLNTYGHETPAEPVTAGMYIARLEGVGVGAPFVELSGKQTEGEYAGMYQVSCMSDIWGERLGVANADMLGYSGLPALHNHYRQYDYYGFDIVFTAAVPDLTIWTGGYALFVRAGGITAEGGNTVLPDDIAIFNEQGENVAGAALETGVRYTFKIRVQKDNTDNAAFGIGVPGDAENSFYIGAPYLLKDND